MSVAEIEAQPNQSMITERPPVVNDFSIVAATVNGSGSQTANAVLIRALFKMGIPVNGKNLFPSNISGLPTWYTIRVSKDGYVARREGTEVLIAFNEKTGADDLAALPAGGVCLYPDDAKWERNRDDVTYYGLPVKDLVKAANVDVKLRDYIANMVYVGALSELLGIELDEIKDAVARHFAGKKKAIDINYGVIASAAEWVREHCRKQDPFRVQRQNANGNKIMIDGNTAGALGSIFGGVSVVAWYPITPSTSLVDELNEYLPQLRVDENGHPTYAVIQAEDELAAAGIITGAGWAGARAMTATSGPGISLMTEFSGLAFFAEVPVVIWDIQRMGPSTGLPTRVSQGDLLSTYYLGHGDTRHVVLLPGSVAECFEFGYRAFDLAEQLQTPVFVLSDLDLGMNLWMTEPFDYPEEPMKRGKVLSAEDLKALTTPYRRYADVDGDGVGYRTLPGTNHPQAAYLSRGTGHNEAAVYSEKPDDWQRNLQRIFHKHETARGMVPPPVVEGTGAPVGIIAFGSADPAVVEARDRLRKQGIETDYLRLRALPMEATMSEFLRLHERVYVVELTYDGQLAQLVQLHAPELATRIRSVAYCDGLPLTARYVTERILEGER